jgi:hypothetical protein
MILDQHSPKSTSVILQPRDRALLETVRVLRLLDREQASRVAGFTSASRAKSRLLALVRAGYLDHSFVGTICGGRKAIYWLPGGLRRGAARALASPNTERFIEHQLSINEVYLTLRDAPTASLVRWDRTTDPIPDDHGVVPDGYAQLDVGLQMHGMFIEVDLGTESLAVWEKKLKGYLRLARSGVVEQRYNLPSFRVLVIARTEDRIQAIRKVIARSTDKVFWLASIETIKRDGFWSAVWLRPTGDHRHSLI